MKKAISDINASPTISYHEPRIIELIPRRVSSLGGDVVIILGENLGIFKDIRVYVDNEYVVPEIASSVKDGSKHSAHQKIIFRTPKKSQFPKPLCHPLLFISPRLASK